MRGDSCPNVRDSIIDILGVLRMIGSGELWACSLGANTRFIYSNHGHPPFAHSGLD